jgi:glycine betaine transporter
MSSFFWERRPISSKTNENGGDEKRDPLFALTLVICGLVGATGTLYPKLVANAANAITSAAFAYFDWLFLAATSIFLIVPLFLAISRHGKLRLGHDDERPEFSTAAWLSMLFAAGMGTGLVFWGVAEPLTHFHSSPGLPAEAQAAISHAMVITNFHWGLHAWGIYCLASLVLAYFSFRKKAPYLPGAPLRLSFSGAWIRPLAYAADFWAVLAIVFGVAGSLGMGTFQIRTGLSIIVGTEATSTLVPALTLVTLTIAYMTSAMSGLNRGIKWLSNINMTLAIALCVFVIISGPTGSLLQLFIEAGVDYLKMLAPLSIQLHDSAADRQWQHGWTLIYFLWWIAWAPFVGVFIARISRGRTIREFVTGVIIAPTAFSLVWFVALGGTALEAEVNGHAGLALLAKTDVSQALFSLLNQLPLSTLLSVTAMLLVFIFLVTSVDSATFVLGMLTSQGALNPPLRRRMAWGVCLGLLGGALMLSDSVEAVKGMSVLGAIPYVGIMILQLFALLKNLAEEKGANPPEEA